ncbi:hypothetical protein ABTY63_29945 [Streptomyces solisilvae]|uniref:hypothetical protein n=1 Tax=Streptomyces malaysiensis TaxID=92644 RepID=UPI00331AC630
MSIASRAASAYEQLQRHSTHPLMPDSKAADVARAAVRLAALLGIDPAHVQPNRSWNSLVLPLAPLTLYASDPEDEQQVYTFSYLNPVYDDEPFFLLGPCPVCGAMVPLAEVRSLADLGAFLRQGLAPLPDNGMLPDSYPDEFDRDPAHSSTCPFREGES